MTRNDFREMLKEALGEFKQEFKKEFKSELIAEFKDVFLTKEDLAIFRSEIRSMQDEIAMFHGHRQMIADLQERVEIVESKIADTSFS